MKRMGPFELRIYRPLHLFLNSPVNTILLTRYRIDWIKESRNINWRSYCYFYDRKESEIYNFSSLFGLYEDLQI